MEGWLLRCLSFQLFFFFTIANMAFPGTSNFISELLVLIGISEKNIAIMLLASLGMLFSSIYSIWLFNRLIFGSPKVVFIGKQQDITKREYYLILPLIVLTLVFGLIPDIIIETTYFSVKNLVTYC
jgi:NADH:ubiquinone oxidoreductase subunit 4 (subunit M)